MTLETLTKEQTQAVDFFEKKLAFEIGPVGLKYAIAGKEPLQIIDLRTKEFFDKGHVPGAVNILFDELESKLPKLSKDKITIVYCYNITCHLAAKAALLLARAGYPVKELVGGWQDWAAHELPIEKGVKASGCSTSSCA